MDFTGGSVVKNSPANAGEAAQSLGQKDSPGEGNSNTSSILAWEMAQTEEPGRLQSMGLQELDMTEQLNNNDLVEVSQKIEILVHSLFIPLFT